MVTYAEQVAGGCLFFEVGKCVVEMKDPLHVGAWSFYFSEIVSVLVVLDEHQGVLSVIHVASNELALDCRAGE